jgi:integrase/recombinase XerC
VYASLHEAIGGFVATLKNAETNRCYRKALAQFEKLAPQELALVDETLLFAFDGALAGRSDATKDAYLSAVISFFRFVIYTKQSKSINLEIARMIKKNLRGRVPVRISNYPMAELQQLIDYARDNLSLPRIGNPWQSLLALRDRALILVLAQTGLRRAEAARLKVSDVDLEAGQAVVIGKGNKQAVIYFGPDALQAVRDYIEARPGKGPDLPLFQRHDKAKGPNPDKHITPQAIANVINMRAREVLGYDHPAIHAHSLRHYFVTTIWQKTGDPVLAKELARHESIQTTMRYTHASDGQLRNAHRRVFE